MTRRLLLIGGAAGAGKSTCARRIAAETGAGWLQLDTVWIAGQEAVGEASDVYRLLRVDEAIRRGEDTAPELLEAHLAASRLVCSWLPRVFSFELQAHEALVADGAWLLPGFVAGLSLEDAVVSTAFLHEPHQGEVATAMASRSGLRMAAPWHAMGARVSWEYGNWLAAEARRLDLPVVTARPRETLVARLQAALGIDGRPGPLAPPAV